MVRVMRTKAALKFTLPGLLLLLFTVSGPLPSDLSAQGGRGGVSREMEQAIRLYHEGDDTEAMDRFMDILVKGSPSEKALANDYINKITLRMNTGIHTVKDRGPEPTTLTEVSAPKTSAPRGSTPLGMRAPVTETPVVREDDEAQRERIADNINSKISAMRRDLLLSLSRSKPVQVYMGGDGMPKALTLDPEYFFSKETAFRRGTQDMLAQIAGLLFTLGKANILVLPEGSAAGDVKIKSIRQALAINSYFESRGISKSRIEVNLTGSEVRYPKELTNISGIIMIFDYEKEPRLKDLEDMQTKGPKVSLGIYPTAISVHRNEGAIVEFSAFESPIGEPTWKFQIFQVRRDGTRILLQEISGHGPMYNQSFWNGRKKFFGASYPSGKYMFTVTALDVQGRETSLSRLLVIRPTPEEEEAMRAAEKRAKSKTTTTTTGLKTRSLGKGKRATGGRISKPAPRKARPMQKASAGTGSSEEAASALEEEVKSPPGTQAGQVTYNIYFTANNSLTTTSESRLGRAAETMGYYPMSKLELKGYAYTGEPNADALAELRVNKVADLLVKKYSIDRTRMQLHTEVGESEKPKVSIMLKGE